MSEETSNQTNRGRRPVHVLPAALVDQIAAGEVVERPASVLKELVENAIDAAARRIRVEVRDGGRALVAVTDDGVGMSPEDARLALERHATSKIASPTDLGRITTYGFRGEALPSMAAVARLRLRTRPRDSAEAFEIRVEAGRPCQARAAAGPEGTRVEVADLFFNVPARRKFLKTAITEWSHAADWLARAALALPAIHFDLYRDERPATHWPAVSDALERIAAVLSERDAAALVPVEATGAKIGLHGFVSRPDHHRPNAAGIYLYVNRRPVRDRLLRHALLDAYRDALPRGRFPAAVLFLDLPPGEVDVNVHPAKWEVRFPDATAVHGLVRSAVREAFSQRRWLTGTSNGGERGMRVREASEREERPPTQRSWHSDWILATGKTEDPGRWASGAGPETAGGEPAQSSSLRFRALRLLGQIHATYLLLEGSEGLVLVDQHAAHERVLYQRLRDQWGEGKVPRQALLAPETLELAPARAALLVEVASGLERFGFEIEPFAEDAVLVRAVPSLLAGREPRQLIRALSDELAEGARDSVARGDLEAADRLFASMACHGARRAGDPLEEVEQGALLEALDGIPWSPSCPHGRPVAIPIGIAEIETRFRRR